MTKQSEVRSGYDYIMPLLHFRSDSDFLKVTPRMKIRKTSWSELSYLEESLPTVLTEFEMQAITHVLEQTAYSERLDRTAESFQRVVTALRLLKAGPLYTKIVFMVKPDLSVVAQWSSKGIPPHPDYFFLEKCEIASLHSILNDLSCLYASRNRNKSLSVALKFFEKSYEDDWETAIVSCWTAFEALCFGGEALGEGAIGPTIRIAVSMLLGNGRAEREQIRKFMNLVYKLRNDVVHGSQKRTVDLDTVRQMQDYLRRSIVRLLV